MCVSKEGDRQETERIGYRSQIEVEPENEIEALVESQMRRDGQLSASSLSFEFHGDVVILHGCVPTYYLKQVAQTVVMRIDGVKRVENRIMIGSVPDPYHAHCCDPCEMVERQRYRRRPR